MADADAGTDTSLDTAPAGPAAGAVPFAAVIDGRPGAGGGAELSGAHSHGPSDESSESSLHRFTSRDPDDFPMPSGREEEWRFTPMERISALLEPLPADGKLVVETRLAPGTTAETVSGSDPVVGNVLAPADRVSALAMAALGRADSAAAALVVRVAAGSDSAEPSFLTIRGEGGTAYGHLIVDVAPGAQATVVVDHVGSTTLAANTEISVGDSARLTFVSLQDWDDDAVHVEAQTVRVGQDATVRHIVVTLGGSVVRLTPTVEYAGPGGDAEFLGLYFTDAGQHQEHRLFVDHAQPHCRSRVTYKGALQGKGAKAVWIGDVLIRPAAVGTDTYELNRNLLLTDDAQAMSVPNLEIETGDVARAGHASASGRFDDLQLFYLMARGIPADVARRLVVRGFFAEVVNSIGVPEVQRRLTDAIEDELAQVGA